MRVLIFCPQFAPAVGGAERQAQRQAAALVRQGVDVQLWTPQLYPDSPVFEVIEGVSVNRFRLFHWPRSHWLWRSLSFLNGLSLIAQVVVAMWRPTRQADIVHCHMFELTTLAAAICGRIQGKPVICKAANAGKQSDIGKLARTSPFNSLIAPFARHLFTHWISITNAVTKELTSAGVAAERCINIPNGIEIGVMPRKIDRVKNFLYLGRLSMTSQRDTDGLIRAFDALSKYSQEVELAIVGGGDLLEHTRTLVATMPSRERIEVTGFTDPKPWLEWADCFVLPSRNEGLSNALLEAMERGLVCVANDIEPNREVLADGAAGLLVPVDDVQRLYDVLFLLVSNPELGTHYAAAGRTRVAETYSLNSVVSELITLYRELLKRDR